MQITIIDFQHYRMGIPIWPEQLHLDVGCMDVIVRLMSFLCHFTEARWWSYAFKMWFLPEGFASFLSPTTGQQEFWTLFFSAAFAVEAAAVAGPSGYEAAELLKEVFWWRWPLVQWLVRLLEHCRCRLVTDLGTPTSPMAGRLLRLLRDLYHRLGDTHCVEETHGFGRVPEKQGQKREVWFSSGSVLVQFWFRSLEPDLNQT